MAKQLFYPNDYVRDYFLSSDRRLLYVLLCAKFKVIETKTNKLIKELELKERKRPSHYMHRYINDHTIEITNTRIHQRIVYNEQTNEFESGGTYVLMDSEEDNPKVSLYNGDQKIDEIANNMCSPIAHKNSIYYIASNYANSQFPIIKLTYDEKEKFVLNCDPPIIGNMVLSLSSELRVDETRGMLLVSYSNTLTVFKLDTLERVTIIQDVDLFTDKYAIELSDDMYSERNVNHILTIREIHNPDNVHLLDLKKGVKYSHSIPFSGVDSYDVMIVGELVIIKSANLKTNVLYRIYNIKRGYLFSFSINDAHDTGYSANIVATEDTLFVSTDDRIHGIDISMHSKKNQMTTFLVGGFIKDVNSIAVFHNNELFDNNLLAVIGDFV